MNQKQGLDLPFNVERPRPKGFIPIEEVGDYKIPEGVDINAQPRKTNKTVEDLHKRFPDLYFKRHEFILRDPASVASTQKSAEPDYFAENKNFGITGEYFIGGSASYQISDTEVIFFNTELIKSLGAVSPYSILSSKKWTWDKLCEYLTFGKGFPSKEDILAVMKATADEKSEDTDTTAAALAEKILPSVISENAKESFLNGEALFYLGSLAEANEFSKTDTVFGLLPIPLFEEGKEYRSLHHSDDITVFACAKSSPDLERAAFIISAANASCYGSMESLFFSVTENSILRHNGSNLSLGYICSAEISVIFPEVESETPNEEAE
jgi:hypothetical protein